MYTNYNKIIEITNVRYIIVEIDLKKYIFKIKKKVTKNLS